MLKNDLIHLLHSARIVWSDNGFPAGTPICVIGSQSVLLYYPHDELPSDMTASVELDMFLKNFPTVEAADLINGAIGQDSMFHETYRYYADGVTPDEIILPDGWLDRAKEFIVDLQHIDNTTQTVYAIQPEDLIASKLIAGRKKDFDYIRASANANIIDKNKLNRSIDALPVDDERKQRAKTIYEHINDIAYGKSTSRSHAVQNASQAQQTPVQQDNDHQRKTPGLNADELRDSLAKSAGKSVFGDVEVPEPLNSVEFGNSADKTKQFE